MIRLDYPRMPMSSAVSGRGIERNFTEPGHIRGTEHHSCCARCSLALPVLCILKPCPGAAANSTFRRLSVASGRGVPP